MQDVLETFVAALENYLGVKRIEFSIDQRWDQSRPSDANGEGLKDYISLVRATSESYVLC